MSVSVSESIGKLLLEGYKMLADSCEVCCTVLMQDRRGRVICVRCESASMANSVLQGDGDLDKTSAPASAVKLSNGSNNNNNSGGVNNSNSSRRETAAGIVSSNNSAINLLTNDNSNNTPGGSSGNETCEDILINEIKMAALTLKRLSSQDHDMQGKLVYVKYIRECADALISVQKAFKKH